MRSNCERQEARLFRARRELVILQAPIEPPDHPLGDLDGVALFVVGGDELVDEALGVDPAQRVVADAELAGVVGNDDRAREQAFGLDRAPQRRLAGRAHRIGRDPQVGKAERAQMIGPFLVRALSRSATFNCAAGAKRSSAADRKINGLESSSVVLDPSKSAILGQRDNAS